MNKIYKQPYEAPSVELYMVNQPLNVLLGFSAEGEIDTPDLSNIDWGDDKTPYLHP